MNSIEFFSIMHLKYFIVMQANRLYKYFSLKMVYRPTYSTVYSEMSVAHSPPNCILPVK